MRQQRTIYFNDARHYYLFAFEPPMALEDAWVPIDEVAGTPAELEGEFSSDRFTMDYDGTVEVLTRNRLMVDDAQEDGELLR